MKLHSKQFTLITRICRTVTFCYAKVRNFNSEITNGREAYVETCHNLQQLGVSTETSGDSSTVNKVFH